MPPARTPPTPSHVQVIDTADIDDAQATWLSADLAAHASPQQWRVTCGHRPFYCSNNHGNGSDCGTFASILRMQVRGAWGCEGRRRRLPRSPAPSPPASRPATPLSHPPQAEAALNARKVDLSISAHMHGYQRSWPLAPGGVVTQRGYVNPTAPVYVTNGAAGNREGNTKPDPIAWSAFETGEYGYGLLTVAGPSLLSFAFVRSGDGAVLDAWNITRT